MNLVNSRNSLKYIAVLNHTDTKYSIKIIIELSQQIVSSNNWTI